MRSSQHFFSFQSGSRQFLILVTQSGSNLTRLYRVTFWNCYHCWLMFKMLAFLGGKIVCPWKLMKNTTMSCKYNSKIKHFYRKKRNSRFSRKQRMRWIMIFFLARVPETWIWWSFFLYSFLLVVATMYEMQMIVMFVLCVCLCDCLQLHNNSYNPYKYLKQSCL